MKQIVTSLLYLLILFSISQFIFDPTHLYYEIWWLDIPMHVLGGFGVASLVSATYSYFGKKVSLWEIFIWYTLVAISWELYEYAHDLARGQEWNGWLDTSADYINGVFGTAIAYFLMKR
jgi:hypothetical protein